MELTHIRTENGHATLITTRAALDEINAGMLDKAVKRTIRQMSAARSSANIEYRDGRKVIIRPATPEEIAAALVVDTAEHVIELSEDGGDTWRQAAGHAYQDRAEADAAAVRLAADKRNRRMIFRVVEVRLTVTAAGKTAATRKPAAPETTADGRRIVTVNGKRYVVSNHVSQPKSTTMANGSVNNWPGGVDYWSERNGTDFGPTRVALANSKPGTVGAAIWAAATDGKAEA